MQSRAMGSGGLRVSAIGLGVMGMSEFYGTPDAAESEATLARAIELGVTFWDTADAYGSGHNETMIGRFLAAHIVTAHHGPVTYLSAMSGIFFEHTVDQTPRAALI